MPRIRTVRSGNELDPDWHELMVNDHGYDRTDWDGWLVLREHLEGATATDLANWMAVADHSEVLISDDPAGLFDPEYATVLEQAFEYRNGQLGIRIDFRPGPYLMEFGDDNELGTEVRRLMSAALKRKRMTVSEVSWQSQNSIDIWLTFNTRSRKLGELIESAEDLVALIRAAEGGSLSRQSLRDLILAGLLDVLIGQPEGEWLDAKIQLYDVASPTGKLSLVQSVAAFANAIAGGLIIFGLGTKKDAAGETIASFHPVPATDALAVRLKKVIDGNMFPPPVGMKVSSVSGPGGKFLMIDIPPQDEELKPFLVHGVVIDAKFYGGFISIVTRRDEGAIPTSAESIHSTLAAGRALLRGSTKLS